MSDWGYKRVTVEAIASRAGIGKGTVYLHWKTKDEMFGAVLVQECVDAVRAVGDAIRRNPCEVRLHRVVGNYFTALAERPLCCALYARDHEVLGRLVSVPPAALVEHKRANSVLFLRYFDVLTRLGIVVPGCDPMAVSRTIGTLARGVLMQNGRARANAVRDSMDTMYRAFEPRGGISPNSIAGAAGRIVNMIEDFVLVSSPALIHVR